MFCQITGLESKPLGQAQEFCYGVLMQMQETPGKGLGEKMGSNKRKWGKRGRWHFLSNLTIAGMGGTMSWWMLRAPGVPGDLRAPVWIWGDLYGIYFNTQSIEPSCLLGLPEPQHSSLAVLWRTETRTVCGAQGKDWRAHCGAFPQETSVEQRSEF